MPIRKINHEGYILTGLKSHLFPYEILLPENYYMIYKGLEFLGPQSINTDFNYSLISNDKFENTIGVINMNPIIIHDNTPNISIFPDMESQDNCINILKKITRCSSIIYIYFNKNGYIENTSIEYIVGGDGDFYDGGTSWDMLIDDAYTEERNRFLCKEYY